MRDRGESRQGFWLLGFVGTAFSGDLGVKSNLKFDCIIPERERRRRYRIEREMR